MKNFYQTNLRPVKTCFAALVMLLINAGVSASTTVSFSNNTVVAIADDTYNGSLATMASSGVTVSGIPANATIAQIKIIASMNHTWVGDVVLKLESPDLAVLGLMSRSGFSEFQDDGTSGSGSPDNLISSSAITFTDTGTYDAESMGIFNDANNICQDDGQCSFITNPGAITTPPFTLNDLYAGTINGTWTFYAGDGGSGDVGDITSWTIEITYDIPAANDDCVNAETIGCSLSTSVYGTTIGSTLDAIYTDCGAEGTDTTERGVWYVYPGDNTQVTITTCDASFTGFDTRLTVYTGTCGAFTCVTANDDMSPTCPTGDFRSSVTFNAVSGTNYYVFVHGYHLDGDLSETGDFILNLSCGPLCTPVPANDACASAQTLTLGVTANGSTFCSSSSPGLVNPSCASIFVTPLDDWYVFTTGAGSTYNLTLNEGTATNTGFSLYTGACGSLSEISAFCFDTGSFPLSLSPSTTYYVRVYNTTTADEGTFDLTLTAFTPATNDECSSVTPATLTSGVWVTFNGTTVNASASADEMSTLGYPIVWEAVTLTGLCNNLTFDYCGTGAGIMASAFAVYTDCPLTGLTLGTDDFTTCLDGNLTANFYNLPAGTYYLPVISDPVFNILGAYTMNVISVDCPGAPSNDSCTAALPISCGTSITGSTLNATLDGPPTNCAGGFVAPDVWYTYIGTGEDFTASLCSPNTDYDTKLDIYTGTCSALVSVDCNDDFCGNQSQVDITSSTLGTTYYIRVHGFNGNVGNYELSILDNAPTITCPSTVNANTDAGLCTASGVSLGTPTSGDDCGVASVTNDGTSTYDVGNTTVTWTVTDGAGQTSTCSQIVTVTDVELPVITCPSDLSVNTATGVCISSTLNIGIGTASDNCSVSSVTNDAAGTTFAVATTTVTWTATDVNGNTSTCEQTITVTDAELPTITCPADVSVSTDGGSCDATGVALGSETTNDNCGVDNVANDGLATYPTGNTTVTWTVTDVNGNSNNCTQTVTVTDNELPTITCPADVNVSTDGGSCDATGVVLGTPGTADNCGVDDVSNDGLASFPVGNTTVTWTVTDVNGNSDICTQTVTVTDDELPVITCGSPITVSNEAGVCGILSSSFTVPGATDNCGIAAVTNDAPPTLPIGTTTVTWTATDINGNTETCTEDITVTDDELPTITCPADVNVSVDLGSCDATGVALGTETTDDNCAVATVTDDGLATYPTGNTTVTWTVTDVNGNTAICTQTVTVTEDELPVITCPTDVSVSADGGSCDATGVVLGSPIATDNCIGVTVSNDAPSSFPVGNTTVTWTATDAAGNTATCAQTVTVTDDELPVISCNPSVSFDNTSGLCGILSSDLVAPTSTDNCGVATTTNDAPATLPVGNTDVTWTVTDVNGNANTCTQTVTVIDVELPTITCPANVNVSVDLGSCDATGVALGTETTADNCAVATTTNDAPSSYPTGNTTVTWTVTDVNGNTAICTQTVTVTEDELPVITCPTDVSVSADGGSCDATGVVLGSPIATDNCIGLTVSNDAPSSFPVGNTTVTWTATDAAGNTATCTQIVTVTDDELPVISCNPSVSFNNTSGLCGILSSDLVAPTSTDNCGVATVTNDAPATLPVGNTDVTWTVTDVNGNANTCTQTVTVADVELPTITCPANVSVSVDLGSCDATGVALGTETTADNCAVATTTNDAPSSYPAGNTTVTWTVTDVNGNTAVCTQTVTVTEDELPIITCPTDVSVSADGGSCNATGVALGAPVATDNCIGVTVANDAPSSFPVGNTTVTWTATDAAGNTATCNQTLTVTDDELPVITCNSNVTVDNTTGICGAAGLSLLAPAATDNCGIASVTNDAPATLPIGNTDVTWTATDVNGNPATCTQTVTITDVELPTITCPTDVSVSADLGSCDATGVVLGTPTTNDNCAVATTTNDALSTYPSGNTTVTWTVTDVNGNTAVCTQTVTVTEDELPVITCPVDVSVSADAGSCSATGVTSGAPVATDNCLGVSVASDAPSSFPVGNTTVTWTATDAAGNTATCTQTVTVTDTELPIITCNSNVTVDNTIGICGANGLSLLTPSSTDNCGIATATNDAPATLPIGDTDVTWTVTDVNGNVATCTQTVTVADVEAPTVTCPIDVSVSVDLGSCDATGVVLGTPASADNCAVATTINDGLSSYPSGNTTVTWTVTDVNGNDGTCTQTVTVTENELPVITCPIDVSVNADAGSCNATGVVLGSPVASDNCLGVTVDNDAPSSFPVGNTTVTWTATDAAGNTATCTQTVTVTDTELPVITCNPSVTVNNTSGICGATGLTLLAPPATDNCGVATTTSDATATLPIGSTTVTWTVTDFSGNSATCTQDITVVDNELPTVTCPADVSVSTDAGTCDATGVALGNPTTADNCSIATVTDDAPSTYSLGTTTVTWTVTDVNGNSDICTQSVTVTDDELPTISCPADVSVGVDLGSCDATVVVLGSETTADNCGVATVTDDAPSSFPAGNTTVTWTATDVNGNSNICTQTVTVTETEVPSITCSDVTVSNSTGVCGIAASSLTAPTAADNCGVPTLTNDAPATVPVGITTVTWIATDASGNSATCSQTVTVNDTELPTITCPADVSADVDAGNCTATNVALGTPTTSDNCAVSTITNDAPSAFAVGNTTVTWTVTDANGNTAICTQTVTVTDSENPLIACPATVTANTDAGTCTATNVPLGTPTTSDNCTVGAVTNDAPSSFTIGNTTVTWMVTDASGNTATCTQTVTVTDNELPTITCPATMNVNTDAGVCTAGNVVLGTPTTSDNCSVGTTTNNAPSAFPTGNTTVIWTATDVNGNTATCSQTVTVTDAQAPVITCPAAVNAAVNASPCVANNVVLGTPSATDNCGVGTVTNNGTSIYGVGTTTVIWTVTDVNGNTASCSQPVTVAGTVDTSVTLVGKIFTALATGSTFQWYNCNTNTIISGQTSASFTPIVSGTYGVIVTTNGCLDTSRCFSFVTSIGDNLLSDAFKVYPNPSTDQLNIEIASSVHGKLHIQLVDLEGRVVREIANENLSGVHTISLRDIASAVYVLRINTEAGVWNTRVMKID